MFLSSSFPPHRSLLSPSLWCFQRVVSLATKFSQLYVLPLYFLVESEKDEPLDHLERLSFSVSLKLSRKISPDALRFLTFPAINRDQILTLIKYSNLIPLLSLFCSMTYTCAWLPPILLVPRCSCFVPAILDYSFDGSIFNKRESRADSESHGLMILPITKSH